MKLLNKLELFVIASYLFALSYLGYGIERNLTYFAGALVVYFGGACLIGFVFDKIRDNYKAPK